jgi:hypothetical protein
MFIALHELERHPVDFDEKLEPGTIDLGADLRQAGQLNSSGRAQLVEEHHGKHKLIKDIRLNGELSTSVEMLCARCLEPVVQNVKRNFDLLYRPLGVDAGREEAPVAGPAARGRAARTGPAGCSAESHLPAGLQGTLPAVRGELEPGKMLMQRAAG